jgi:hypothetical protein
MNWMKKIRKGRKIKLEEKLFFNGFQQGYLNSNIQPRKMIINLL